MRSLRLSGSPGEIRIALLDGNSLLDAALWRPGAPDGWKDTHLVRITKTAHGLGGAFVQMEGGKEGFLSSKHPLSEGSLTIAQVVRAAQNGKELRLKPVILPDDPAKENTPRHLSHGPTPLEDFAAFAPEAPILFDEAAVGAAVPADLRPRLQRVPQSFDDLLENEWDALGSPSISVGSLIAHITPTPALIAIDLDTTSSYSINNDFEANLAAFPSLLRQIRLRNLSGTILIDPAGIKSRKRPALVPFLREALKEEADPLGPSVSGITPAGLLELTRPRRRPSFYDLTTSAHGQGLSILRHILRENLSGNTLHAPPEIIYALEQDKTALESFALHFGQTLTLKITTHSPISFWKMT